MSHCFTDCIRTQSQSQCTVHKRIPLSDARLLSSFCGGVFEGGAGAFRFVLFRDKVPEELLSCSDPVLIMIPSVEFCRKQNGQRIVYLAIKCKLQARP